MKIEVTEHDCHALLRLIDAAVRSQGLQAAYVALVWQQKLQEALNAEVKTEVSE